MVGQMDGVRPVDVEHALPVVIYDEETDRLPFEKIRCPDLHFIGSVWAGLPRVDGEPLPRWSAFSPSMITRQLSKVCILHVGDWRRDQIKFTLYGGHATERVGNGRALNLHQLRNDPKRRSNYRDIRDRAGRAVDHAAPQYALKNLSWDGCSEVEYELLMLPFMAENGISRVMQPLNSSKRPDE